MSTLGSLSSIDGTAWGNPGPAASGTCAWWSYFRNDVFVPNGMLVQREWATVVGWWLVDALKPLASILLKNKHFGYEKSFKKL